MSELSANHFKDEKPIHELEVNQFNIKEIEDVIEKLHKNNNFINNK